MNGSEDKYLDLLVPARQPGGILKRRGEEQSEYKLLDKELLVNLLKLDIQSLKSLTHNFP